MSILGCIADVTTVDTVSANPSATYPIQSHGGKNMTCSSIYSNNAKITHLDPVTNPTDVTGVGVAPIPPELPRTPPIVGIVNSATRGVYFEDVLVPVIGDGINAPLATPEKRPLTTPTLYPTIHIGTRT